VTITISQLKAAGLVGDCLWREKPTITQLVSGGQTGLARAALEIALGLCLSCAGWGPKESQVQERNQARQERDAALEQAGQAEDSLAVERELTQFYREQLPLRKSE
jgi:hypothetical protein